MNSNAQQIDVVGVGNALVDFAASVEDADVAELGLAKGSMVLVDEATADRLHQRMAAGSAVSGGSAPNTMVGVTAFGGTAALVGKVADDSVGRLFAEDLRAAGVIFDPHPGPGGGPGSGRCVVLIHPDGERTMCTFLGAANGLGPSDVDEALIARGKVAYLEGYLWDLPDAKAAFRRAARHARRSGGQVALGLSDSFCVGRHRESFLDLIGSEVDLLFANEAEIRLLFEVGSLAEAVSAAKGLGLVTAITLGDQGSIVVSGAETVSVPAVSVPEVVDTTGAGDLYASGFLYGVTHGLSLDGCARMGAIAAAEVISHVGARPQVPLLPLGADALDTSP